MAPRNSRTTGGRGGVIKTVGTPLGFCVLSMLIIEAMLTVVLCKSKLSEEHIWYGFLAMLGLFLIVFLAVIALAICLPRNLLFGKEEYANPLLDPSALRDQIEDLIAANVKPDCLKLLK